MVTYPCVVMKSFDVEIEELQQQIRFDVEIIKARYPVEY